MSINPEDIALIRDYVGALRPAALLAEAEFLLECRRNDPAVGRKAITADERRVAAIRTTYRRTGRLSDLSREPLRGLCIAELIRQYERRSD